MARPQRLRDDLSFGGRVPWAVGLLLLLTIAASLAAAFTSKGGPPLLALGALAPENVFHAELWRLVTWSFLEPSALGLIFGGLALYWFGSDLASEWGSSRFLAVFGGVTLFAAGATCGVALVNPAVRAAHYFGSFGAISAMVVAWGLWFPHRVVRIYFVLPVRGLWVAWLTILGRSLYALHLGWEAFVPELFGYAAMLAWLARRSLPVSVPTARRVMEVRRRENARRERVKKRMKAAAYLRVVESQDDDDPPPLPPDVEDRVRDLFKVKK